MEYKQTNKYKPQYNFEYTQNCFENEFYYTQTPQIFNTYCMIDIAAYSNYEALKETFDIQVRNLKCPDGCFIWNRPKDLNIGDEFIIGNSINNQYYLLKIWGVENMTDPSMMYLGNQCILCRRG